MGLFVFLLFIGLFAKFVSSVHKLELPKKCSVHTWVYENDRLICSICRKTPEQTILE